MSSDTPVYYYQGLKPNRETSNLERVLLTVTLDECPSNPADDWDSYHPVFAFEHKRYTLGTKDGTAEAYRRIMAYVRSIGQQNNDCFEEYIYTHWYNPTSQRFYADVSGKNTKEDDNFNINVTEEMWRRLRSADIPGATWYEEVENPGYLGDEDIENLPAYAEKFDALCIPVYLYDHGAITMRLGQPFSCPWDSGQIGWVIWDRLSRCQWHGLMADHKFTKEDDKGDIDIIRRIFKEYNNYIMGDVWGCAVYTGTEKTLDGRPFRTMDSDGPEALDECSEDQLKKFIKVTEAHDSCWGFYGSDEEAVKQYADSMGIIDVQKLDVN